MGRFVSSRYLRVLWGEKIGYEDGLRRAGCPGKRRRKNSASIHPRIQSSHPTKHVNSDWVRVCLLGTFTKQKLTKVERKDDFSHLVDDDVSHQFCF